MPQVVQGERPGMVFNVSYGLQGQARYTHVPSILEMVGIPYVGSGPLGHSLAARQGGHQDAAASARRFHARLRRARHSGAELPPDLTYPMIVKPKNEAVSFGLKVVDGEDSLREAASVIFNEFRQPVLAEQYITGREINVGILGNDPVEAFQPVLLDFGDGAQIYTYEDKTGRSGRQIRPVCPAPIGDELTEKAKENRYPYLQGAGVERLRQDRYAARRRGAALRPGGQLAAEPRRARLLPGGRGTTRVSISPAS